MSINVKRLFLTSIFSLSILFSTSAVGQFIQPSTLPTLEEAKIFLRTFDRIKRNYVTPVENKKLFDDALKGMLSGLDPHSAYMTEEEFAELKTNTSGSFGGLGIEVSMENELVKVVSPIDDTPAARAGIQPGDLIFKIDGTLVRGMSLLDAVKLMRGKPDTTITLTILRKGTQKPFDVKLVREIIKIQSVKSKSLEPGYVYIRVSSFQEPTGEALAKALTENINADTRGIVLDLRNNPGGLLRSAVGVSGVFLKKDALITYTEGRREDTNEKLLAKPENYLTRREQSDYFVGLPKQVKTVPMVVIINGGSASASEIVAGALQDHKRAVVIGTQSFGKGSVQEIMQVSEKTAIKLTISRYFTPNGRSIQAKGITPDVVIVQAKVTPIETVPGITEAELEGHLSNPQGENQPTSNVDPKVTAQKADFQLNQALMVLKALQILQR